MSCVLPFYLQAASTVRHLMLPAHWTQRASLVIDLVKCYGCGGRTIVFTHTKNDANELTVVLSEVSQQSPACFCCGRLTPDSRLTVSKLIGSKLHATCSC